jgi:hypothetical protein
MDQGADMTQDPFAFDQQGDGQEQDPGEDVPGPSNNK